MKKNGFTLVELSIVLVIIGLIVGGIVGGQSLVQAAKTQAVVRDITTYVTAINTFQLQFDALPGDFYEAEDYWGSVSGSCYSDAGSGTATCSGDGDGIIDFDWTLGGYTWRDATYEPWRAWEHLQNAEILATNYSGVASNIKSGGGHSVGYVPGENVPKGPYENSMFTMFYIGNGASWNHGGPRHVLTLASPKAGTSEGRWYNAVVTPSQQKAFDKKMDDGAPYTGQMMDVRSGGGFNLTPNCTDTEVVATAKYDTSRSSKECILMFNFQ